MTRTRAWSPSEGPGPAPEQRLPSPTHVRGDGDDQRSPGHLWAPSEGPVRTEPGGAGGEPDGKATISSHSPFDED